MSYSKLTAGLVFAAGVSLALSGCTPAVSSAGADAGTTSTADLTDAQAACVDAVSADVEAASAETDLVVPTAPLDLAALEGKSVWYITVSMNQFSSDMASGIQAAGEAAGVDVTLYDGQGLTNRFNEGIQQAVAQGADGIILLGIDPAVVSASLADAAAAGIAVQNAMNSDPDDAVPDGMYGNFTADFTGDGERAAKWALVDSGCSADMVSIYSSSVGVWQKQADGAQAVFDEYCPDDCTLTGLNVDLANLSTDVGSQLGTAIQRDADVNYVFAAWDSAVPYISPVLATANSEAKVLSRDGLQVNLDAIVAGDQTMTIAMPPTPWIGWASFDDIARAMTGAESEGYVIPSRIVDTANVEDGTAGALFPNYDGYEEAFTSAWSE
ncbi:sugar ABC transporter substrate-binding protein [Herbiconiux sp. P15]|uniref:sugar ABC transporter substrate-binding protein n=1 Tax=Herbiconiux liukaitaii TaxID=3342799 RepID=UPI0035B9149A